MSIILGRIDNRLLHGIVASQWSPVSGATRVMVIDDQVANDPILKEGMKLGKPPGVAVSIISLETALANFKVHKYDGQKVFIIAKHPKVFLELAKQDDITPKLIVGGTLIPEEEAVKVSNRAYVTKEEEKVYREISGFGVNLVVQYVPADAEKQLSNFITL